MTNPWKREVILGDGQVRLLLGDCREILPTLGNVDAVVMSPPYNQLDGLNRKPSGLWGDKSCGLGFVQSWQDMGYADCLQESDYQLQQNKLFSAIRGVCNPTASLFYNHQLRWRDGVLLHPVQWFQPDGWRPQTEIIWDRAGGMMFNARMFVRFDERILWFTASDKWKWNQDCVGLGTIWRIARAQNKEHPVAYPVELPTNCIVAATDAFDTVLDPFCGSGTTGVAAVKLGRRFIGIEIEPRYFDIAVRRISDALKQPDMFIEKPKSAKQGALGL